MAEGHPASNDARRASRAVATLVAVLSLLVFAPVVGNDFVDWDDLAAFADNPHYRGLGGSQLAWMFGNFLLGHYQPLSWVTLGFDYLVWGMNAGGYHLTSLLLHAANGVLCFLLVVEILERTLPARPSELTAWRSAAAVAAALFFSLHPLRVEPVAWAAIRGDTLAAFFFLASLLAYLRARKRLSLGLFAVSLLSKATGLALPAVLLVLDALVLRRFERERAQAVVVEKLPWLALTAAALLLAAIAKAHARALVAGGEIPHGLVERLLQASYGLCFYLVKTVAPTGLAALYPLERQLLSPAPVFYVCALAVVGITVALWGLRRRAPALLGVWVCYVAIVSPVLGLGQSGPQIAADRYTYLASVPWSVLLGAGLVSLVRMPRVGPAGRRAAAGAVCVVLALLSFLSWRQTLVWHDSLALWDRVVAVSPESGLGHFFRANTRRLEGQLEEAIAGYNRALELDVPMRSDAYNNRGFAWQALGDRERAIADMSEAIRIEPEARWFLNRGSARIPADVPGAIADWSEAIRRDPDLVDAYHARGAARGATGRWKGAIADYRAALSKADAHWSGRADAERRLAALQARHGRR